MSQCTLDEDLADGHLDVAQKLLESENPTQSQIRRSISTSYYAVFHALARMCANCLIGRESETRSTNAWVEVYRGLEHGKCKKACESAKNIQFPDAIKNFAETFIQLQEARCQADYNPKSNQEHDAAQAHSLLSVAESSIASLRGAKDIDKRAFAAWVLITASGAEKARKTRNAPQ